MNKIKTSKLLETEKKTLGKKIKIALLMRNLSAPCVGNHLKLSSHTIASWRWGRYIPSIYNQKRLITFLKNYDKQNNLTDYVNLSDYDFELWNKLTEERKASHWAAVKANLNTKKNKS